MNINIKLWYNKYSPINIKYLILLVLAGLHYHKKITDEKLKGQFKALREGTLQRNKNTYHCEITDNWYNNEPVLEIFQDCIDEKGLTAIPFNDFIKYISRFENKNYNYALNVFGSEYIMPLFNFWNPEYTDSEFTNYIDFYIPGITVAKESRYCYECGASHNSYSKNERNNTKVIIDWLHNQKKGNLSKIPKYDVTLRYGIC